MARQPSKRTETRAAQPMDQAPRDGTLVELVPVKGNPFIGYFDSRRSGWADWGDLVPLIRPDVDFAGWRRRKAPKGSPRKAAV